MKKLIAAAVISVILAAAAISVVAVVIKPASPKPIDTQRPVVKVAAPAGTTAGTTPTSTGMVFVASSTSAGNVLSELSTRDGKVTHRMTLEGTGATTSIAISGPLVCVGFDGQDHGGLVSCFETKTREHTTSWVAPGAVLDLNGRSDGVGFDLLVNEGGQKFAVTIRLDEQASAFEVTHQAKLPPASVSLVALAGGDTYYALGNDGTISSVDVATGAVQSTLPVTTGATRLAISNDETHLYALIREGNAARVDVIAVVSGKVTSSIKAERSTMWILPTIDNARLVEFAGDEHSGSVAEYRFVS